MPHYEYACKDCAEHHEVVQSFSDPVLTECPACQGALRKVFSPIGIAFNGSGFYRTDSRRKIGAKSMTPGESGGSDNGSGDKGSSEKGPAANGSGDKSSVAKAPGESKPAASGSGKTAAAS